MDANKTTTNWIIAGLVALVVIIGGGWLIARERSGSMAGANTVTGTETVATSDLTTDTTNPVSPSATKPTTAKPTSATPTSAAAGETVSVNDQKEGATVTVSDVNISKPTWVAVRDSRPWYLGWKLLKSNSTDIVVPLQRNTTAGQSYEVVLFVDNGDGEFAIHGGDTLVTTSTGAPVSSSFRAQ